MRTGACTVQQALTAEAASVLKHSLNLARRRGHAQVTPLHVAATLLSSSYSSSNLLRRACLKSQPRHPASHPLQCRALELCFNVALNRLPTSPPPSSGSLIHPQPSLSNALVAALKRAQAHQRRGCIELQQQQQQPPQELQHQQQQQPLLAIKVELEQLILSILDDPSVSRVMREAGFSSTCVKSNLEEESSVLSHSSPFLLETRNDFIVHGSNFWQNHFIKLPSEQNQNQSPAARSSLKEDVKLVLELMLKKQGRTNAVVVGDSTSMTDGLVAELVSRVERGDVPDELKSTQFINLQISYVHLRLMNKSDVDRKVSDLRRKIGALTSDRTGGGVVICAGDLRWAVDEEARGGSCGFKPVEHMVAEMGRLLSEFRGTISHCGGAESNSKVWLLATASFQTYMRCQMRQPSLENQWALQAVMVPSGGLALSLQTSSGLDSRTTKTSHYPVQLVEPKVFSTKEDEKYHCCTDCASNFEKEASALKPETTETINSSVSLPCWLQPNRPRNHQREDSVKELRRKWSRLCQSLHQDRHNVMNPLCPFMFNQNPVYRDSTSSSQTWWSGSLQGTQSKKITETLSIPFSTIKSELGSGFSSAILNSKCDWPEKDELTKQWLPELSLHSIKLPARQQVGTTLALGSTMYSDSATSKDQTRNVTADLREVRRGLQENIPWQSEAIPSIVEALQDLRTNGKKGTWILIQGSDHVAKRRIALVMAESLCGSADKLIRTDLKTCAETIREALAKDGKCVFLIEGINGVHSNSIGFLMDGLKESLGRDVSFTDAIFVLAISKSSRSEEVVDGKCSNRVLKIKLHVEGSSFTDLKRKQEEEPQSGSKKRRTGEDVLDLNLMAADDDDDEDAVPSDLTHETDCGGRHLLLPQEFMESAVQFTLEAGEESSRRMAENIVSKLRRSFDAASRSGASGVERSLVIDRSAVEELMESSGFFLESLFEGWAREVLHEGFSLTVEKGGSVRLVLEGKEGNDVDFGFMGSVLPNRIYL